MNMLAYEADIQLYLLRSFIYSLAYCIKEGIEDNSLEIKWRKWWSMRQLRPETGESLAISQNTNKTLFGLCTNLFTYFIIKGIKVKNVWRWIKKVLAFDTDFFVWIIEKTVWNFILIDRIISMHEYVCKCAMVIWNYITQWFS